MEPLDHIVRPSVPWRTSEEFLTECGKEVREVRSITRDNFAVRLIEYGKTRTAMITCVTCYETASRWKAWEEDPVSALNREINWERKKREVRLRGELFAIAKLIEKHKEEFETLVMGYAFNGLDKS